MKKLVIVAAAALAAFAAAAKQDKLVEISVSDTSVLTSHAAKLGTHCGVPMLGMMAAAQLQSNPLSDMFGPMRQGETLTAVIYGDASLMTPSNFEEFGMKLDLSAVYPCNKTKEKFLEEHPDAVETNGVVVVPSFDVILFSPDGKWVATGGDAERARLVLAEAGKRKVREGLAVDVRVTADGMKALNTLLEEFEKTGVPGCGEMPETDKESLSQVRALFAQVKGYYFGFGVGDLGLEFQAEAVPVEGSDLSRLGANPFKVADALAFAGKDALVASAVAAGNGGADPVKVLDSIIDYMKKNGFKFDFFKYVREGANIKCEIDVDALAKYAFGEGQAAIASVKDPDEFIAGLRAAAESAVECAAGDATPQQAMSFAVKGTALSTTAAERYAKILPELKDKPVSAACVFSFYAMLRSVADGLLAAKADDPEVAKIKTLLLTLPPVSDGAVAYGAWKEDGALKMVLRISPEEIRSFTSTVMLAATSMFTTPVYASGEDGFMEEEYLDDDTDED